MLRVAAQDAQWGLQWRARGVQEPPGPRELGLPRALQEPRALRALGSPGCALRALGLVRPGWIQARLVMESGDASRSALWDWGAMQLTPMHLRELAAASKALGSLRRK